MFFILGSSKSGYLVEVSLVIAWKYLSLIEGQYFKNSAICSNPKKIDFYTQLLSLKLVKLSVNFDYPTTYHPYWGDEVWTLGPILTFFPWSDALKGNRGTGQAIRTSFLVRQNWIDFWKILKKIIIYVFKDP